MLNVVILALLYKKRNMSGDKEYQKQNAMIYSVSWGFNFALWHTDMESGEYSPAMSEK